MLKKLVKYDFNWMTRNMVVFFAITVIVSILTRIADNFTGSVMGDVIYAILRGCAIAAFVNTLISAVMRIWVRFRHSFYKDESYLTHTLPVRKNALYDSKTIASLGAILLSLAVIVACFFIAFWNNDIYEYFRSAFKDGDMTFVIISIFVTAVLEVIYAVNVGMFSIVVGHRSNNGRVVRSVVLGVFLYFFLQSILLGIIYAMGMFDDSIKTLFGETENVAIEFSTFRTLLIATDVLYLAFSAVLYFIGRKLFSKGVNVE